MTLVAGHVSRRLILALLIASSATPAAAGSISLSITSTVAREDGQLTARVRISNLGDEAAQSVTPVLRFRGQRVLGDVRPALAPKGSMEVSLSVPAGDVGTGRWPYELAIDYTDGNMYPFQALHVGLVQVGNPPPPKAAVPEIKAGPIGGSGTVRIRVKNLAGVERRATVGLLAPEGIEVTLPTQQVTLAPWGESAVSGPVVNRTALPGSRYTVFATVQYEDEGVHQAVVSQGIVDIVAPQSFFQTWRTLLWAAATALVLLWLGFVAWKVTASRARRAGSRP
jgi:hypothetical protein